MIFSFTVYFDLNIKIAHWNLGKAKIEYIGTYMPENLPKNLTL